MDEGDAKELFETCETCRFYHEDGICRRYPPSVPSQIDTHEGGYSFIHHGFPETDAHEWCGEYQREFWNAPTPFPAEN